MPACKGRIFDFKRAYKQVGIHAADRRIFRIAVNRPGSDEPTILGVNFLPFGAVGSVAAFLRISIDRHPPIPGFWTAFLDDYGVTTRNKLVASTEASICTLLKLQGVEFANERGGKPLTTIVNLRKLEHGFRMLVLGSSILYLEGMRISMFQLSGFYLDLPKPTFL